MKKFFEKQEAADPVRSDKLFRKGVPLFLLEIIRKYCRLEVEGLEHIPKRGRGLVIPNHSGVTALDAVMIGNEISRGRRRIIQILAHPFWFIGPNIRVVATRIGLVEASKGAGLRLLRKNHLVMLFPEGEAGNFKPTANRYHLHEFRRGFVRMAMATQAPIIPTVVIGAEETNINLSQLKLTRFLKGVVIPLPLNVLPLPAKWKIIFLPPVEMKQYTEADAANTELVHEVCEKVRALIQTRIADELAKREWIYFPRGSSRPRTKSAKKAKKAKKAAKRPINKKGPSL